MRISAVIFDWAGTMVDYGSIAPVIAMRKAFADEGLTLSDVEIRADMGLSKRDHVAAILQSELGFEAWSRRHSKEPGNTDIDRIFQALSPLMAEAGSNRATLIPGAAACVEALRRRGVRIGSTTGYTRAMMDPIQSKAAEQGYAPDAIICAGEASSGRPAPYMIWRALERLDCWPTEAVVKVDDAPAGILEGLNAGCLTIGVSATGNAMGLDADALQALPTDVKALRLSQARSELLAAGAHFVIDSVADLAPFLSSRGLISAQ
jgi:phosphonoacetaldehyde hydrolase